MSIITPRPVSIFSPRQPSAGGVRPIVSQLRAAREMAPVKVAALSADAHDALQSQIDQIMNVMRSPLPLPDVYGIADATGRVVMWVGNRTVGSATNYGVTAYDLGGNLGAWMGVQSELPKTITATSNASPDVITITGHGYVNGDTLLIQGATGDTAINGLRIAQSVTANTFQLTDLNGVAINGNGVYGGGGTATRYYAGGFFQTVGIAGTGFANAKIRAFADGTITITGATFSLTTGTVTTTLNNATDATYGTDGFTCRDSSIPGKTVIGPQAFAIQGNDGATFVVSITAAGNTAGDISLTKIGSSVSVALHASQGNIVLTDAVSNQVRINGTQIFASGSLAIQSNTGVLNFQPGTNIQINGINTANGTITYVKSVNFGAQTVTTGTITVNNGLITAFT